MTVCILLGKSVGPAADADIQENAAPRPEYVVLQRALSAVVLSYDDVQRSRDARVVAARARGLRFGLAVLGFLRRRDFDHFYCTGEDVAFPFAALMSGLGDVGRTTTVVHNIGTRRWSVYMRALPIAVWRNVICLGQSQQRIAVEQNGMPSSLVHLLPNWVDTNFFDPDAVEEPATCEAYAFACGRERRDYPTLIGAAENVQVPFRLVASGTDPEAGFRAARGATPGRNVVVERGPLTYPDLRAAYAGAALVVVPLLQSTYSAGVTSVVESMSMGKPVITTDSVGITDYVRHQGSEWITPVGDSLALARAVRKLFEDPVGAAEIGKRNRDLALEHFSVDRYAARVAELLGLVPSTAVGARTF